MAKNYYDILGISSPAMRKHFMDVDKTVEDVKNVVSNMSAATLVTEDSLQEMTTTELLELADTKPIMMIDDSFNNCINLMWLSTVKRGYKVYDEDFISLHFENDYMDVEVMKNVATGDVTQYYPHLKDNTPTPQDSKRCTITLTKSMFDNHYILDVKGLNLTFHRFSNYQDDNGKTISDVYRRIFAVNYLRKNVDGDVVGTSSFSLRPVISMGADEIKVAEVSTDSDAVVITINNETYNWLGDNDEIQIVII